MNLGDIASATGGVATSKSKTVLAQILKAIKDLKPLEHKGTKYWVLQNLRSRKFLLVWDDGQNVNYQMALGEFPVSKTVMVDGLVPSTSLVKLLPRLLGFAAEIRGETTAAAQPRATKEMPSIDQQLKSAKSYWQGKNVHIKIMPVPNTIAITKLDTNTVVYQYLVKTSRGWALETGTLKAAQEAAKVSAPPVHVTAASKSARELQAKFAKAIEALNKASKHKFIPLGDGLVAYNANKKRVFLRFSESKTLGPVMRYEILNTLGTTLLKGVLTLQNSDDSLELVELKRVLQEPEGMNYNSLTNSYVEATAGVVTAAPTPLPDRVSYQIIGDLKRIRSTVKSWKEKGKMTPDELKEFVAYETKVGNFIAKEFLPRMSETAKAKLKELK